MVEPTFTVSSMMTMFSPRPSSWARVATFLCKYTIAPQRFPKPSWEESYQQWHFNTLAQWKVWMYVVLIAAFVGFLCNFLNIVQASEHPEILSTILICAASSVLCLLYFFAVENILNAIRESSQTRGAYNARDLMT
eukprot:77176-Rhodomonas_salina.1